MSGVSALIDRMRFLPFLGRLEEFTLIEAIGSHGAGLDIHPMVCGATGLWAQADGQGWQETRTFSTFRREREALGRWLQEGEVIFLKCCPVEFVLIY
jgi:hypothetical protein